MRGATKITAYIHGLFVKRYLLSADPLGQSGQFLNVFDDR